MFNPDAPQILTPELVGWVSLATATLLILLAATIATLDGRGWR